MDMSGMSTNDSAYTGSVCMSITVVGNTTNLALSDPFCNTDKCLAFKAAHAASQAATSYYDQYDYGYYTTWYYLAVVGVGMFLYAFQLYQNRRSSSSTTISTTKSSTSLWHKLVALLRIISYRSIGGAKLARWRIPRLGMLIFFAFTWLFFLLLTFYMHPYYRDRRGYGSPPLGVRTGLMSTALTPIIVALSGKVNLITLLTGINHEKLNILHRWAAILCLFLALVHTIPFIVQPLQKCGADGLRAQFYKTGGYEYTGVPPLAMLVGLVVLSVPWIRHHYYNLFIRLHIPIYIVYLATLFWHAGNQQDSWAYLWATLAIWLVSVLIRLFYKWQTFNIHRNWFSGFSSTVQDLPGDMTRITVLVPTDLKWKPGQHCFIRMPHLSLFQNHPYTIANLPSEQIKGRCEFQEMEFYVRAHHGLTRNLLTSVEDHKDDSVPMHIDGPYGGVVEDIPARYQSLVFVAGGSGITACLPHIFNAVQRIKAGKSIVTSIRLVWMVRHPSHTQWVLDELKHIMESTNRDILHLDFYVTDVSLPQESGSDRVNVAKIAKSEEAGLEDKQTGLRTSNSSNDEGLATLPDVGILHNGRPYLPDILLPLFRERRIFVLGSGPASLQSDLGNAVARAQQKVLNGQADVISLSTEMFGW